jgi:hypothetical protein
VYLASLDELLNNDFIGFPGTGVLTAGKFMISGLSKFLIAIEPRIGSCSCDAETFSQFGDGEIVHLVVIEEPLSLFAHGDTIQGMGHLLYEDSVNHVLVYYISYCLGLI